MKRGHNAPNTNWRDAALRRLLLTLLSPFLAYVIP
jgi:hypothetical protein